MLDFNDTEKLLQSREEFLKSVVKDPSVLGGSRLIKKLPMTTAHFTTLQAACFNYLVANLVEHNPDFKFNGDYNQFVIDHAYELKHMASVTPNGVVRPKKETLAAFNGIQHALAKILKDTGVDVKTIRAPISIRIVTSEDGDEVLSRPRSNHKLHSDFWTGAVCDFAILIPVFGTLDTIDVVFGEPTEFTEEYMQEVTNYSDGRKLYGEFKEYPTVMEFGNLFLQDIFCLHGTRRRGKGVRVSIDFTLQSHEYDEVIRPHYANKVLKDNDNHVTMQQWLDIGSESFILESESIEQLKNHNEYDKINLVQGDAAAILHQTSRTLRLIETENFTDVLEFAGDK